MQPEFKRCYSALKCSRSAVYLTDATVLMHANLEEPISIKGIAVELGISRRHLERLFRQAYRLTPSRYYRDMRLDEARVLLANSNHSVIQVGLMTGFSSPSHFSSVFATRFSIPPKRYRNHVWTTSHGDQNACRK